jgi:hypothetical protein
MELLDSAENTISGHNFRRWTENGRRRLMSHPRVNNVVQSNRGKRTTSDIMARFPLYLTQKFKPDSVKTAEFRPGKKTRNLWKAMQD